MVGMFMKDIKPAIGLKKINGRLYVRFVEQKTKKITSNDKKSS